MATRPEELQRRANAYDDHVVDAWAGPVDTALLDMLDVPSLGPSPTVLVAECRTGHLAAELTRVLPESARLMVVDPSSEMLDLARKRLEDAPQRIFYSTQSMTHLSYADGVFHAVFCANGLLTRGDLRLAGNELLRVLRPEGILGVAIPLRESFRAFPDMLRESLIRLEMRDIESSLDDYLEALVDIDELNAAFDELDLTVAGHRRVAFDLTFDSAEDFLFSPFVEDLYLPRWLAIGDDAEQREPLFYDVARALNTYFLGVPIVTHVAIGCALVRRDAA